MHFPAMDAEIIASIVNLFAHIAFRPFPSSLKTVILSLLAVNYFISVVADENSA